MTRAWWACNITIIDEKTNGIRGLWLYNMRNIINARGTVMALQEGVEISSEYFTIIYLCLSADWKRENSIIRLLCSRDDEEDSNYGTLNALGHWTIPSRYRKAKIKPVFWIGYTDRYFSRSFNKNILRGR